jgi:hypothetical protein
VESWSTGVLKKLEIEPSAITPKLQYSNTPKIVGIELLQRATCILISYP